jgi:hypothetical protein
LTSAALRRGHPRGAVAQAVPATPKLAGAAGGYGTP